MDEEIQTFLGSLTAELESYGVKQVSLDNDERQSWTNVYADGEYLGTLPWASPTFVFKLPTRFGKEMGLSKDNLFLLRGVYHRAKRVLN